MVLYVTFSDFHVIIATQMLCYLLPSNTRKPVEAEKYVMDFCLVSTFFCLDCVNVIYLNSGGPHYNTCSKWFPVNCLYCRQPER